PAIQSLLPRVTMRVDPEFDKKTAMSQARVSVKLRDGKVLTKSGDVARGYPGRLTDEELRTKFRACTRKTMREEADNRAWTALKQIESIPDVRQLMEVL